MYSLQLTNARLLNVMISMWGTLNSFTFEINGLFTTVVTLNVLLQLCG